MPVAVVTGASGGVGRDVTARLIDAGWLVFAQFRPEGAADAALPATWWQADFAQPLGTVRADLESLGLPDRVDALIHCAGVCPIGTTAELTRGQVEESLAVNLLAPMELTAQLLPRLRLAGGHVIYVNSGAGLHSHPRWSGYSAAKHAARAWADALRAEEPDIRVTSVYPGRINTDMQRRLVADLGEKFTPERYLSVATVAGAIVHAVSTPADAQLPDISLRPR